MTAGDVHGPAATPGTRFAFGDNWAGFAEKGISDVQRRDARVDLEHGLGHRLDGLRFLDIGSGSGLHSVAALDLGAVEVRSFDYDETSVATSRLLREQMGDERWTVIEQGDVLDADFMERLGTWDVVYSWGVLHHTGDLWSALHRAADCVAADGELFVALYSDQGLLTRYWTVVKRLSHRGGWPSTAFFLLHWPYHVGLRYLVRRLRGRGRLDRGMSFNSDLRDWIGGWPFQAATVDAVVAQMADLGFLLRRVITVGRRHGCNEFVFVRSDRGD